jgi:hypothetical protein
MPPRRGEWAIDNSSNLVISPQGGRSNGPQWMMNPYQGYLSGAADITRSQGEYPYIIQQARLPREEARRSALPTRHSMIEEAEWERAHPPVPEKIRQRELGRELDRARSSPPLTEICSGRPLNALLRHLIVEQERGVRGPNVPLSEYIPKSINLRPANSSARLALLKDKGNLKWPTGLQKDAFKENRVRVNALVKTAYQDLMSGRAPAASTLADLQTNLVKLEVSLDSQLDDFTNAQFIEAARYLRHLNNTLSALRNPEAARSFRAVPKSHARNVADLVKFLREKKLEFAPAGPGEAAAYVALYHALAAYDARQPQKDDKDGPRELHRANPRLPADDLVSLRRDYDRLLNLADAEVRQCLDRRATVPRRLIDAIMGIADQWRAVDPLDTVPCRRAAQLLCLAGQRELAWEYLTSPSVLQQGSAADWLELAHRLRDQHEHDLAERAFAEAAAREPSNAEIVWERALNHRAAGRAGAARALFQQLDKGVWDERYRSFQSRARQALREE